MAFERRLNKYLKFHSGFTEPWQGPFGTSTQLWGTIVSAERGAASAAFGIASEAWEETFQTPVSISFGRGGMPCRCNSSEGTGLGGRRGKLPA